MKPFPALWTTCPPVLKALSAQALVFLGLAALAPALPRMPFGVWSLAQGLGAALLVARWGLGLWWWLFQVLLPLALAWQLNQPAPAWVFLAGLSGLLLIYGGGILTRVPLYNSGPVAWEHLLAWIPQEGDARVADLGAGLGGPLAFWARHRPDARFLGVEASPLVWLVAWLRTRPFPRCRMRLGSLWKVDLREFDLVFAFLSPAPMAALWKKARREMRPGTLLISHSFPVPDLEPETRIPLPGRPGACLLLYRIPDQN